MVEANDSTEVEYICEAKDIGEGKDIREADTSMEDNDYMMGPEYIGIHGDANATKESEEDMVARDMVEEVIVEAGNIEETAANVRTNACSLIWDNFDLSFSKNGQHPLGLFTDQDSSASYTFFTCLACLNCLNCLSCLTGLTCLTRLDCLDYLSCLTCSTCLTYLTCLTCLTCHTCMYDSAYLLPMACSLASFTTAVVSG
jgi:hypothetical protein